MQPVADMLKGALANYGAPAGRLRLNSHLSESDIAQTVALAICAIECTIADSKVGQALALIEEIAALDRDCNDEFGDVIIDGQTDLFDRICDCADVPRKPK
jgi:hypothetical protein